MLIGFPLSFFMSAFIIDVLYWLIQNTALQKTGYYLVTASRLGSLLAAAFGFVDYLNTVPLQSAAKMQADKHDIINVTNPLQKNDGAIYLHTKNIN